MYNKCEKKNDEITLPYDEIIDSYITKYWTRVIRPNGDKTYRTDSKFFNHLDSYIRLQLDFQKNKEKLKIYETLSHWIFMRMCENNINCCSFFYNIIEGEIYEYD